MDWREELSRALPSPHRQEPASLRDDIADELADHLACALERERAHTADEAQAQKKVLERFGDPRQIALKLWLDAMKEKLMKDRIVMVSFAIMAIAALAALALAWQAFEQSRHTNQALMAAISQLAKEKKPATPAIPSGLASLSIRVVKGSPAGPPVSGVHVQIKGHPFNVTEEDMDAVTRDGLVTFGPINPGRYKLTVWTQNEPSLTSFPKDVVIYGGTETTQKLVLPDLRPATAVVRLGYPNDLKDEQFLVQLEFEAISGTESGNWPIKLWATIASDGKMYSRYPEMPVQNLSPYAPLDYKLREATILTDPMGDPRRIEKYRSHTTIPINRDMIFKAQPQGLNEWKIVLPTEVFRALRWQIALKASGLYNGNNRDVDEKLSSLVDGQVKKIVPVNKDCMILKYMPDWAHGEVDNIAIDNNDGGVRTLINWAPVPAQEAMKKDMRFLLALYSRKTDDRFDTKATARKQVIGASAIGADWPELVSWTKQPKRAQGPEIHFDFMPGEGWKIFDVTPILRAQAEKDQQGHGLMLHFIKEDLSGSNNDWSGYQFVSREGTGEWFNKRPVLLAIEKPATK